MKNKQQKLKTRVKTELITFIVSSRHIRRGRIVSFLKSCVDRKLIKDIGE